MIILDGGLGRLLEIMGAPFRQPEWSALALMEAPHYVRLAHDAFIAAGAGVITTNSYAVVPFHIGTDKFHQNGRKLISLSGKIAREAANASPDSVMVAGSVPPMFGSYQPDAFNPKKGKEMMSIFRQALSPYVDLFLAETYGSILEAQCFLTVFKEIDKPVWLSVTLEDVQPIAGHPMLRSGELLKDFLAQIFVESSVYPAALLFNCSQPEVMEEAVRMTAKLFTAFPKPPKIGVYANAFSAQSEDYQGANAEINSLRVDMTPESYCEFASRWVVAGAELIGGCCGIIPAHIRLLKSRL